MLNRRGTALAWGVLFLVVLTIIVGALFVFASYRSDFYTESEEYSNLIEEHLFETEYVEGVLYLSVDEAVELSGSENFLEDFKLHFESIVERRSPGQGSGNLFAKVARGEYEIFLDEEGYKIILSDVFVETKFKENSLKRTWDLELVFDNTGVKD